MYIYIYARAEVGCHANRQAWSGRQKVPSGRCLLGLSAGLFCSNSYLYYVGSFKGFYKESIVGFLAPILFPGPLGFSGDSRSYLVDSEERLHECADSR